MQASSSDVQSCYGRIVTQGKDARKFPRADLEVVGTGGARRPGRQPAQTHDPSAAAVKRDCRQAYGLPSGLGGLASAATGVP